MDDRHFRRILFKGSEIPDEPSIATAFWGGFFHPKLLESLVESLLKSAKFAVLWTEAWMLSNQNSGQVEWVGKKGKHLLKCLKERAFA